MTYAAFSYEILCSVKVRHERSLPRFDAPCPGCPSRVRPYNPQDRIEDMLKCWSHGASVTGRPLAAVCYSEALSHCPGSYLDHILTPPLTLH